MPSAWNVSPCSASRRAAAVAVAYAARHPERVSHLILYGAYARGWEHRGNARELEARRALQSGAAGWGREQFRLSPDVYRRASFPMPVPKRWSGSTICSGSRRPGERRALHGRVLRHRRAPAPRRHHRADHRVPLSGGCGRPRSTRDGCLPPASVERSSCRCRAAIICCSNTSPPGRFCCESWGNFSAGDDDSWLPDPGPLLRPRVEGAAIRCLTPAAVDERSRQWRC